MGKLLQFPMNSQFARANGPALEAVTSLLSSIADQQIRTATQLEGLLAQLEVIEKSLLRAGAPFARDHALTEQTKTIEFLIGIARKKLRDIRAATHDLADQKIKPRDKLLVLLEADS